VPQSPSHVPASAPRRRALGCMGNACSTVIARPVHAFGSCSVRDESHDDPQPCGLCGDNAVGQGELMYRVQDGSDGTPRTPRGPVPPWAIVAPSRPVDRTATGATPPRSPTPPRSTPPGLPDDESRDALNVVSLISSFDIGYMRDLFRVVRCGDVTAVSNMLKQVTNCAVSLVCNSSAATGGQEAGERNEKTAELVVAFLAKVREGPASATSSRETLLGAAAGHGQLQVIKLLLNSRADPLICDDRGCTPLHRAGESANLVAVLLVLDRLQASQRNINVAQLTNSDGETPEMLAALAGASDVCRAFEVFSDMQNDAELRQLGSSTFATDLAGGHRSDGTGDLMTFMDLSASPQSPAGSATASLLKRVVLGNCLMPNLFVRIPDSESELRQLVDKVCHGIVAAEENLLSTPWHAGDPGLDPAVRSFVAAAEVRTTWQSLRSQAAYAVADDGFEDFWHTHLSAKTMTKALQGALGDTFQLLLTVL